MALLPTEILSDILDQLLPRDIVRLMRCNRHLHYRLEPCLYRSDDIRDRAMATACKRGSLETISLLVTKYGQDSQRFHGLHRGMSSPLTLTVQKNQPDAYRLLIRLGANVTDIADTHWCWDMRKSLGTGGVRFRRETFIQATCEVPSWLTDRSFKWDWRTFRCKIYLPSRTEILRCLIESAISVGMLRTPRFSLGSVIMSGASLETVQALVDHSHASSLIRELATGMPYHYGGKHMTVTPVTAAIIRNSTPILDLLLSRGYSLDSDPATDDPAHLHSRDPLFIPVFAAAYSMAINGDTAMMQRCLDSGADINRRRRHFGKTPLNFYLESISSWEPHDSTMMTPAGGINYLVDQGAIIDWPRPLWSHYDTVLHTLFTQWDVMSFRTTVGFADAVSHLIQHGAGLFSAPRLLAYVAEGRDRHPDAPIPSWWAQLVSELIDNCDDAGSPRRERIYRLANEQWEQFRPGSSPRWHEPEGGKDKMLWDYISAISQFTKYEAFAIERMLEAGANINALAEDPNGKPSLS